jgi:hypothetical protein
MGVSIRRACGNLLIRHEPTTTGLGGPTRLLWNCASGRFVRRVSDTAIGASTSCCGVKVG